MIFRRVAIIGVGLIGGSVGKAIKKRGLADTVVGIGRRVSSIKEALRRGAIDEGTLDPVKGIRGADLVIIATPVGLIPEIARKISGSLSKGCIMTDVGSTKGEVVRSLERVMPKDSHFIGSHPLAGSEKRGVKFAQENLLKGSVVIMTKTKRTKKAALDKLSEFWRSLGVGRVVITSPDEHDTVVAEISHLPHIAAVAIVNTASDKSLEFASSGFKDTTRIAASDPGIWRDICVTNRRQIIKAIERYERNIVRLKNLIRNGSAAQLRKEFERSKARREKVS